MRGFDQKVWDKFKYAIVLLGNWHKFSQNRELREFLLSTGDSVLVEASPYDAIWGIRLPASSPEAQDPMKWRGQNLLGFALMEVRDELRRVTQNEMLCDWSTVWQTMKLYELVNHYHIGTELTCAEAMFLACNEYYHLNLSEETRKMFSVMGLGMQTEQSCCGAFTVAVGIIGLMTAKEGQTDVDNMEGYQMIAELTDFMLGFYGTLHCVELQKLEIVGYENPMPRHCGGAGQKAGGAAGGPQDLPPGKYGTNRFMICRKEVSPCLNYHRKKYNHFAAGSATETRN